MSTNIPNGSQLWHSVVRPGNSLCHMHMVEALPGEWHLSSIAWHPNPAAGAMYAVMHESGDVMLVDGLQTRITQTWLRSELFPAARVPMKSLPVFQLKWSPDGSKLFVASRQRLRHRLLETRMSS